MTYGSHTKNAFWHASAGAVSAIDVQ